ncbi:MAG: orotate phosphoribosyltransferase [Firmicutes bacterium]|jgi:orotate phosphoribosyltransferase|nr:orotate phosphoribosyltransferase [Bacillota bacterium]HPU01286.1 orotate phosphoribosyltransferase [Bacillota bacterium]
MNCPALDELRHKLLLWTYIYSYRRGSFILSSGRRSSYYIDGKQVTMAPEGLGLTAQYILTSLQQRHIQAEAIGGLTLGADPIAAGAAVLSHVWAQRKEAPPSFTPLASFIVRKEAKGHGTRSRIEGPFYRGMRAVIVDDVLTTGASVLAAASAVEEAGGSVSAIYVLVDRLEGGRENIEKAGYLLDAAMSRHALEELQEEMERRYPALSGALQAEEVPWEKLPWEELQPHFPSLAPLLKEVSQKAAAAGKENRLSRAELEKTAGRIFSAVKAAVYHPNGEAEAMRLARLLQKSLD